MFEQTDYAEHLPLSKKGVDMNNAGHDARVHARGRHTDAESKQRVNKQEPVKRDYEGYNA